MMTIIVYRFYCQKCDNEEVIRRDNLDSSSWKIQSVTFNEGVCPECSEAEKIKLEGLDAIGEQAAQNLREAGYDTTEAIADASDEELLDVSWIGEKALFSLKEATMQL